MVKKLKLQERRAVIPSRRSRTACRRYVFSGKRRDRRDPVDPRRQPVRTANIRVSEADNLHGVLRFFNSLAFRIERNANSRVVESFSRGVTSTTGDCGFC